MTSITATVPRATATASAPARPARPRNLRDAPWVRAALGVAIGGLLVADLAVILRERADAAAAGRAPAAVPRAETARDASAMTKTSPAVSSFFDEVAFTEAVAGSVASAAAATIAVVDAPADVAVEVAGAPTTPQAAAPARLAPLAPPAVPPAAGPPRDTAPLPRPPVPPLGDAGPGVSGLVASIPLVGATIAPVVAPVVEPVLSEAAPLVDAAPADAAPAPGGAIGGVVESVVEPVTAPVVRPRLLG